MLTEIRQVIFTSSDLAKALKHQEFLDKVSQDLRVINMDHETTEFAFSHGLGETLEKITLETALVLRAMIQFCLDQRIPLPRHALKTVEVVNGDLALQIRIDPQIRSEDENSFYVLI